MYSYSHDAVSSLFDIQQSISQTPDVGIMADGSDMLTPYPLL